MRDDVSEAQTNIGHLVIVEMLTDLEEDRKLKIKGAREE